MSADDPSRPQPPADIPRDVDRRAETKAGDQQRDEGTPETDMDLLLPPGRSDNQHLDLVRTATHTDEEVSDFLSGKQAPSPGSPPRDVGGQPIHRPELLRATGMDTSGSNWADPTDSVPDRLSLSPSDAATEAQGDLLNYPGRDHWVDETAHPGDRVWFAGLAPHQGADDAGTPIPTTDTMTGFGVPEGQLHDGWQEVALNGMRYNEGTQVAPKDGGYRPYLYCYEFQTDMPVATGTATENTRHGAGGTPQMFVPEFQRIMSEDKDKPDHEKRLVYVGATPFDPDTVRAHWP
jgi:hypothetical protein